MTQAPTDVDLITQKRLSGGAENCNIERQNRGREGGPEEGGRAQCVFFMGRKLQRDLLLSVCVCTASVAAGTQQHHILRICEVLYCSRRHSHNSTVCSVTKRGCPDDSIFAFQLEQKQIPPPYRPRLENDRDLANFPPEFTDEPVQLTPDDQ